MIKFSAVDEGRLQKARDIFRQRELVDALLNEVEIFSDKKKQLSPSQIFQLVQGSNSAIETEQRINEHVDMMLAYQMMLYESSAWQPALAIAASSDELPAINGNGWKIRSERSNAEHSQIYVIVELTRSEANVPEELILCDSGNVCARFPLPAMRHGVAQFIVEEDSEVIRLLSNPNTTALIK